VALNKNPEQVIWDAARKIFLSKGLSGARMQDIADEAGINKALLHYYYRSKEKLFVQIFEKELTGFVRDLESTFTSSLTFFEKIERFVDQEIRNFSECPELPLFLLNELSQQISSTRPHSHCMHNNSLRMLFRNLVHTEIEEGRIKKVDADQLFIHVVSLTVYPFMAKPMIKAMLDLNEEGYQEFIRDRKKEICSFIFDSLSVTDSKVKLAWT